LAPRAKSLDRQKGGLMKAAGTYVESNRSLCPEGMRLIFTASQEGVRGALGDLRAYFRAIELCEDACGTVEIVLAEALNNVAEHAYAMSGHGEIELQITLDADSLRANIIDKGAPLPGLDLPRGDPPCLSPDGELPEGGFGWFMIRRLTSALNYRRADGRNHLHIEVGLSG